MIPLLLDQSGGASVTPFIPIVEADHPWRLHETRDQPQHISWAVIRSDKETYIKLTPTHQVGDVATRHLRRADVAEDPDRSSSSRSAAASACNADCLAANSSSLAGARTARDASSASCLGKTVA